MSTRRFSDIAPPPLRVVVTMAAVLAILLALVVTAGRAGATETDATYVGSTSGRAVIDGSLAVDGSGIGPALGAYPAVGPAAHASTDRNHGGSESVTVIGVAASS
jgi:hypothetical protein